LRHFTGQGDAHVNAICSTGYQTEITVLSLRLTYASMKNRDLDVFLVT